MNELVKIENNEIILNDEWIQKYRRFQEIKLEMELQEKQFKEDLKEAMTFIGKHDLLLNGFSATIKKASIRTTLDSTRLKKEMPEIYEKYSKTSEVSSSITIKCE